MATNNAVNLNQLKKSVFTMKNYVDTNKPRKISEEIIFSATAEQVQAGMQYATDNPDKVSWENCIFEMDINHTFPEVEAVYLEYQGNEFFSHFYASDSNMIKFFTFSSIDDDYDDTWIMPEGELLCYMYVGKDINKQDNPNKCFVRLWTPTTNITDFTLKTKNKAVIDNELFDDDVKFNNSISMNRAKNTNIGPYSIALGEHAEAPYHWSIALGNDVHARGQAAASIGQQNISQGTASITMGWGNRALANYSYAQGRSNLASAAYANASGYKTKATGSYSKSSGVSTTASGSASTAEGNGSVASGANSHAEGEYTIAKGQNQHAEGKYNIEDTANTYAHIVGNGSSNTARSNAHTLDWNGNAWYAGKLSQDGEPIDDKDLVTKKYLENSLENKADKIISNDTYDITADMERVFNGEVVELNMSEEDYHETLSWSKHPVINNIEYMLERTSGSEEETFNTFNGTVTLKDFFVVGLSKISCMDNVGFWGEYSSLIIGHRKDDNKLIIVANWEGDYTLKARFNKDEKCLNVTIRTFMGESTEFTLSSQGLTGLASETYVNNKIAELVNSAPEALDTLNELSQALGNDPNFATTMTNALANKVNKVDGKDLSTNDLTNELKANYDAAYAHSQSAHAPSNAQKNSDITKAEIEAKLTGNITTHTHSQYLTEHQDISGLALKSDLHAHTNKAILDAITSDKINSWDSKSTFSGSYNDLADKPTIPTKTSQLTNDSGYLTEHQSLVGLATETYVNGKVSDLVNSSPATLDTLKELADALGNDPNFATTVSNQIGNKVDKVSGKGLSTNDLTSALKANYDAAYNHSKSAHAPSNAQKNSDITKAEIEAKLTGNITTHTHSQYLTSIPSEYITEQELTSKGYITEAVLTSKGYATESQINSAVEAAATTNEEVKTTVNQILGGAYIE